MPWPSTDRPPTDRSNARASRCPDEAERVGELRDAIDSGGLVLEFQPTVRLRDRQSVRLEALVRWPRPAGGRLQPAALVALAERSGLGPALSSWVMGHALHRYRDWQRVGIDDGVAVNVRLADLLDRGFPDRVRAALRAQRVESSALTLEVSARDLGEDQLSMIATRMADLSESGVRFALDDFGISDTTLLHLMRLPFAELKVDGSVIGGLCTESRSWRVVRRAIDGAHDLGMQATGEGVEDETTANILERLGCDVAQGRHLTHGIVGDRLTFVGTTP